jgi:clan AA aspartic protease (TIGR02281 family)
MAAVASAVSAFAAPADDKLVQAFSAVYAKLGVTLPAEAARDPHVLARLGELKGKPCDRKIVLELANALEKAGYRREAAEGLFNFVKACGGPDEALNRAVEIFLKLPDDAKALAAADELVRRAPKNSYAAYLRGTVHEVTGDSERALADYAGAIELYGKNKKSIPARLYLAMAGTYAKLGRFCEAATPIRIWVSLDPINRDTASTQTTITDYQERGNCVPPAEAQSERYPLRGHVVAVQAEVNGIRGNFILDTGASFVAVRSAFADRARIPLSPSNQVPMATANGYAKAILARADRVSVGKLATTNVPIVVLNSGATGFGPGVDGLLGMSFLSRFDVRMTGGFIEIATRRRH